MQDIFQTIITDKNVQWEEDIMFRTEREEDIMFRMEREEAIMFKKGRAMLIPQPFIQVRLLIFILGPRDLLV